MGNLVAIIWTAALVGVFVLPLWATFIAVGVGVASLELLGDEE